MFRTADELEATWAAQPAPPRGQGRVRQVVARKGGGEHEVLDRGYLTVESGLAGDRWSEDQDPEHLAQVTLMNATVVALIGGDAEEPRPGDNLIVDLDLSEEALPPGTRVRIGTALVEITAEPHTGCKKFAARFGVDALKWVNGKALRSLRLRGIYARVLEDGTVAPGDAIVVLPD